ncbi:hypothetical protein OEZ85_004951 [Tetradesmus obliquus]|uniref:Glutathione S-transferase n=1 Tax=Tetradesmus obliquus TaxID=3088 RepID=A0ABY8UGF5_TETOB|nr:hypothetical protein OEZ85_004951 [Tetradesmus obliquus]
MSSSSAPVPVLTYFNVPGRGEIARLLFTIGKVDFEDKQVVFEEWGALKPTTPFGQIPILQVGDTVAAQSAAIDHYAAKLAGLQPQDPLQALLVDQTYYFVTSDIHTALISPTAKLAGEEQLKARQALSAPGGPLKSKLAQLEKLVAGRSGKFIVGEQLSLADLSVFNFLGMLKSGFWAGIPADVASDFPALTVFRNQIASLPEIAAYYAAATDELRVKGYRSDEA